MSGEIEGRIPNLEDAKIKQQALEASHKFKSSHAVFFGTDDLSELKKKTADVPEKPVTEKEPTFANTDEAKEWREIHALARSVFHVYFTNNDYDQDIGKMSQAVRKQKQPSLISKINGTMPWLPTVLKGSSAPAIVKQPVLFMEASFRGIAQVRVQQLLG